MARPKKYDPTPKEVIEHRAVVRTLASLGYSAQAIIEALDLDISPKTLSRHYGSELRTSRLRTVGQIGAMLVNEAVGKKSVAAANSWLHWFGDKPVREREEASGKLTLADLMRDLE